MKRPNGCLVLAFILFTGCKPNVPVPEAPPKIDGGPVVSEATTLPKAAGQVTEEPKAGIPIPTKSADKDIKNPEANLVLDKMAPLDLSPLGVYATIDAPVGSKAEWSFGNVISLTAGNKFDMELKAESFDLAKVKKEELNHRSYKVKNFVVETPDTLVVETDFQDKSSWFFYVNVRIGEQTYACTRQYSASKDEAMRYVRVAKSLRQSDAQKKLAAAAAEAVKALEDVGVRVTFDRGKYSIEAERQWATDALLAQIAKLPLHSLELSYADAITPAGMALLGTAAELRKLSLRGESFTDTHLAFLASLKNIERIHLEDTAITGPGLAHLAGCTKLTTFTSSNGRIDDSGYAHLAGLKALTLIDLWGSTVGDIGVAHFKGLTALEILGLSHTNVGDEGLKALAEMRSLKSLSLEKTKVTGTGLVHLSSEAKLEDLNLQITPVTDAGLASLKNKTVRDLLLSKTTTTGAGLVHLKDVRGLESLDLSYTGVNDAGLVSLKDYPSLVNLNLNGCAVGDAGMVHVAAIGKLGHLRLVETKLTGAGLETLKALKSLTDIDFRKTEVTPAEVEAFKKARDKVNVYPK